MVDYLQDLETFLEAKVSFSGLPADEEYYLRVKEGKMPPREAQIKLQDKVMKVAQANAKDLEQTKDSNEQNALDTYASSQYIKINAELRSGKISKKYEGTIAIIDKVMAENKLKHDMVLYRAVDPSAITKEDLAYKSTSVSPLTANNFKRGSAELFRFKIPKGTNYAYIGGGEMEVLLPRDFQMKKYIY